MDCENARKLTPINALNDHRVVSGLLSRSQSIYDCHYANTCLCIGMVLPEAPRDPLKDEGRRNSRVEYALETHVRTEGMSSQHGGSAAVWKYNTHPFQ